MSLKSPYISYLSAMSQLRKKVERCERLEFFSFNIQPDELGAAYALLDKQPFRRILRLTYSDDYNFIVKCMPSGPHEAAARFFDQLMHTTAERLTGAEVGDVGFYSLGSRTYQLDGGGRKEPDSCYVPVGLDAPTIVLEMGVSESLMQLRFDARRWLEYNQSTVRMVILVSIDPPIAPNLHTPRIRVEHWKLQPPPPPLYSAGHRTRVASKVWAADWTLAVSPNYSIPLADIFGPTPIPAIYGGNTHLTFDTALIAKWRQIMIM